MLWRMSLFNKKIWLKIIDLQLIENLKNKKIRDISYDFSYAKEEPRNFQIEIIDRLYKYKERDLDKAIEG